MLILLSLLLLAVPAGAGASNAPGAELRIVSSNVRLAGDAAPLRRWESRRDRLAALLAAEAPHILGTQEGWRWQLEELAERLPGLAAADAGRAWEERRMYPTIFYDPLRFELLAAGDRWLSDTPELPNSSFLLSPYPRFVTWAALRERASGAELFVANTHLTHVLHGVRRAQARVLAQQVRALNVHGAPAILLGDFNERPTGATRSFVASALPELVDPFGTRDEPALATFNDFGGWLAGGRIDWILADRRLAVIEARILDAASAGGGWASDHHPVSATLRLSAAER